MQFRWYLIARLDDLVPIIGSLYLCVSARFQQRDEHSNVQTQVVPELSPELAALNLNMEELTQSAFDLRFILFFFTNIILSLWLFFALLQEPLFAFLKLLDL